MEGWIALTNYAWGAFLRDTGPYEEVNVWIPADYFGLRERRSAHSATRWRAMNTRAAYGRAD
jgi:hypothetical protein